MSVNIGSNIRKFRILENMTQDELADKVGVAKQTIFKYETGRIENIPTDKIKKIASALNRDYLDLISDETYDAALAKKISNTVSNTLKTPIQDNDVDLETTLITQYVRKMSKENKQKMLQYALDVNLKAAHMNKDATPEQIQHDNDIMNDDSLWDDK